MSIHLGLRDNRHMVSVLKPQGWRREALGRAFPEDMNPRLRILEQWGLDARSPRSRELATIDVPLAPRAQAILSYQVSAGLRAHLASGVGAAALRRDAEPGVRQRVHLGAHGAVLPVDLRAARAGSHSGSLSAGNIRARHGSL